MNKFLNRSVCKFMGRTHSSPKHRGLGHSVSFRIRTIFSKVKYVFKAFECKIISTEELERAKLKPKLKLGGFRSKARIWWNKPQTQTFIISNFFQFSEIWSVILHCTLTTLSHAQFKTHTFFTQPHFLHTLFCSHILLPHICKISPRNFYTQLQMGNTTAIYHGKEWGVFQPFGCKVLILSSFWQEFKCK